MYRVRILHRFLNQTCHNQLFGTAIIINELALISVLSINELARELEEAAAQQAFSFLN